VQILSPKPSQQFSQRSAEDIVIQAKATDNEAIARVEFLVDGEVVSTRYQLPFVIPWPAHVGEHVLVVRAYDLAGQKNEASLSFTVAK
jgi:hypothetical protein